MSLAGDFSKLARLQAAVRACGDGTLRRTILTLASPVLATEITKGFDQSVSPQGRGWRPLKRPRARGRPNRGGPLYDSGALRTAASTVSVDANGFVVTSSLPYANRHLHGDRAGGAQGRDDAGRFTGVSGRGGIPARPFLPTEGRGLPRAWRALLDASATRTWRGLFLRV